MAAYSDRLAEKLMPRLAIVSDSVDVPYKRRVSCGAIAAALGTTWGQHAMHPPGQSAPQHTDCSPTGTGLTSENA